MRILMLYRPKIPGLRAQTIQWIHSAHALANHGYRVTVLADQGVAQDPVAEGLSILGLSPHPNLTLLASPFIQKGAAGLWFRTKVTQWWAGSKGVVYSRDGPRFLPFVCTLPHRHTLVYETHALESALHQERGDPTRSWQNCEEGILHRIDALVANCEGTMNAWETIPGFPKSLPRCTIHNATRYQEALLGHDPRGPIRCIGSAHPLKGVSAFDSIQVPQNLEWIGATQNRPAPKGWCSFPPVPQPELSQWLRGARALVLPLADNLFGREMTSPLKLWDYLTTDTPIVAPDTPAMTRISTQTGVPFHRYKPAAKGHLQYVLNNGNFQTPRRPYCRTWAQRAADISDFLKAVVK
jgi:hypothetical protein